MDGQIGTNWNMIFLTLACATWSHRKKHLVI